MVEPVHLVSIGGALGAIARYQIGQWLTADRLPVATFVVNLVGTFLLGVLTGAESGTRLTLFVGAGFCGAFTTYSSFSIETVRLWETGERARSVGYAVGTLGACLLGLGIGWGLGRMLAG